MKGILAICIFSTLTLLYFSANFYGLIPRTSCPESSRTLRLQVSHESINGSRHDHQESTNIFHILFGIGGSAETWGKRRQYCEVWWRPNTHRGFVWLDQEPGEGVEPWPKTSPAYKVSADTSRFKYTCSYGSRSAVRIARIVKESFELGLKNVRWFVMGDDDTVFFTENLVNVLSKYDHNQMYYIGGNSESVEQDLSHSYRMAYGGGGFAISYPLAAELVRILDGCIDRYADLYGSDQKIGACMSEIGVPLTKELGFHQLDIQGSPYGLLSAHPLAPLVSLHHLDYIQPLFPGTTRIDSVKKLVKAYKSDPTRALQHSFCYDLSRNWSVSVSWGYSVQLYPFLMTGKDLSTPLQTFLTWRTWSQEPFTFNTQVMSLDPCERPLIYYFDGVKNVGNGETLTRYRRRNPYMRRPCAREHYKEAYLVKGFNVSAPMRDPQVWNKAPRRHCCEVMHGSDHVVGVLRIRIRSCNHWESVSPP
ncbi:hypothetical protein F511_34732 [Dorcoceras hygrometricum]|uniref:Uncharacterized protein n=1 Tax=Dorcoceras hygrometricum TaxID=472368 RepID=A0A2Z7D6X0_9LAMI|nr:hypothetical protein F511_34732 [Dorcoceras hygrometricum]